MLQQIQAALADISRRYQDKRIHHWQLEATALTEAGCVLHGTVLDGNSLAKVTGELASHFPGVTFETKAVRELRQPDQPLLTLTTNLTGLYDKPSWLAEMRSQLLNGAVVELLWEEESWVYACQMDGYLGWMYRPYLAELPLHDYNHIVCEPVSLLRCEPAGEAALVSRVPGGTLVQVTAVAGEWAQVALAGAVTGWTPLVDVRALHDLPQDENRRRAQIVADAFRFVGVPYLWGGCTALGIDCSGYAQLLHRLNGVSLPRDADMQYETGKPVEPPFQPGDLLFFGKVGDHRNISHVGMSLGGWRIIHSSRSRNGVYSDDVAVPGSLHDNFVGARTFLA